MNKKEAIKAMQAGEKITHTYFSPEEWMTIDNDGKILLEDGVRCSRSEFFNKERSGPDWEEGYSIWKEPTKEEPIPKKHPSRSVDVYVPGDLEVVKGQNSGWTMKRKYPKPGRNQPCPCGSGIKFKNCNHQKQNQNESN